VVHVAPGDTNHQHHPAPRSHPRAAGLPGGAALNDVPGARWR
jgi:hypothetical protein